MDKPLPHDVTLEKIVLGTVLIEPSIFDIVRKYRKVHHASEDIIKAEIWHS